MSDLKLLFGAFRQIVLKQQGRMIDSCPEPEIIAKFPEGIPDSIAEHIAFCPTCRMTLQIIQNGRVFAEEDRVPDWERIQRRLNRSAHWVLLKERIRSITRIPLEIIPVCSMVPVRLADPTVTELTLTIFEINLTERPCLSKDSLKVTRLEQDRDQDQFNLEISGFDPALAGAEARLGLARQEIYLTACGYRSTCREWDLSQIEMKLQYGLSRQGGLSGRFNNLIRDTVWFEGIIETGVTGTTLLITAPEMLSELFLRRDVWSMLLVSQPS